MYCVWCIVQKNFTGKTATYDFADKVMEMFFSFPFENDFF